MKSQLKKKVPGHSYRMWIEPIEFFENDNGAMVLACPNLFSKKRIFANQTGSDIAVIGIDDPHSKLIYNALKSEGVQQVIPISSHTRVEPAPLPRSSATSPHLNRPSTDIWNAAHIEWSTTALLPTCGPTASLAFFEAATDRLLPPSTSGQHCGETTEAKPLSVGNGGQCSTALLADMALPATRDL